MLNRRFLRIKVMQALYAFFQSHSDNLNKDEKELFRGIEKIYDLYLYLLLLLPELSFSARVAGSSAKFFPSKEDQAISLLDNNKFIFRIAENNRLKEEAQKRTVNWRKDNDISRKILMEVKKSLLLYPEKNYFSDSEKSFADDKNFALFVIGKIIEESVALPHFMEEKEMYWYDHEQWVYSVLMRSLKECTENPDKNFLLPVYKNETDDKQFVSELFCKTIVHNTENEQIIGNKTKNWEVDRIALLDIIMMKMAITEMFYFSSIPVKVTIDEYLDISKEYSTPKSNIFINGVLDKLVSDFKKSGKMQKTGRGLIE